MILAIDTQTFDSLSEPNQQGVKNAYPSLLLGVPAEYKDGSGKKWYVFSHSFPTGMIAKLASMTVNMEEIANYDSNHIDDDGDLVVQRDGSWVKAKSLSDEIPGGEEHKSPQRKAIEEARANLSDDLLDQLRNHVTHPIDEGPHDTPQEARDAQEPQGGALDGTLGVDPDMSDWSRVEPDTV